MRTDSDYENLPHRTRLNVRATVASNHVGYYESPYDRNCNDASIDESRFCNTLPKRPGQINERRKLSADFSSNYSLSSMFNANTRTGSVASINNNSNCGHKQSNSSLPTSPISAIKTSISSIVPLLSSYSRQQQQYQPYVMSPPIKATPPLTNLTYASTSAAFAKMHHMEMENNYLQNGCGSLLREQVSGNNTVGGAGGSNYLESAGTFENYTDIPMHEYASLKNNNGNNNGNNSGSNFNSMRLNRNLLLKRLGNSNKFY